jgi:hypothetical protein
MTKPTAEIIEENDKPTLRVDFNDRGFTIPLPVEDHVLDVASKMLVETLAGTSAFDLKLAAIKALNQHTA